ncbi:MAG: cytochrome c maturation protein CcmE [Anaerolineae bacterium]|uniref:cytochrome c maturation protein CcmE n=1 Tax=Candidatus Amarolinea dominans TaxID=3140696 RepID=UPI003136B193|nr:cytochrome c maturation protein CcmE [Anaerolineae bacterium]
MAESSAISRIQSGSRTANKQLKFIFGGVLIAAVILYLIISVIGSEGAYYKEVGEVQAQQAALIDRKVRVSGLVEITTVSWDPTNFNLDFTILDQRGTGEKLPVHFHGVQPDNMTREGSVAIVEGRLRPDGVLDADTLLLKCPSRYEEAPQEVKKIS